MSKKILKMKAWAVIEDNKILSFRQSWDGEYMLKIFPTKHDAEVWNASGYKIIRIEIKQIK